MDIQIRSAKQSETELIIKLIQSEHGDCSSFDINRFIVAIADNAIVGCVRIKDIENEYLELSSLVVDPKYRNSGIGTKLVREMMMKDLKRPVYLLCMDTKEHFYNNVGFSKITPTELPKPLVNEYLRVSEKMPQIRDNIIAMRCI